MERKSKSCRYVELVGKHKLGNVIETIKVRKGKITLEYEIRTCTECGAKVRCRSTPASVIADDTNKTADAIAKIPRQYRIDERYPECRTENYMDEVLFDKIAENEDERAKVRQVTPSLEKKHREYGARKKRIRRN